MVDKNWWLDLIEKLARVEKLLTPTAQQATAIWLGEEGPQTGRVSLSEGFEQVAPTVFGVYPEETGVHTVPVDIGVDGRVSRIYPPTTLSPDTPVIGVGDAGELLLEVPANRELLDAHDEHLAEIDETITQIDEHNRDVVDPFIRDTDHALTVELPAAKQAAQDAQAKAVEALTVGGRAENKADDALYIGNLATQLAQGMIWVDEVEPPFDSRVDGQVWIKINADGQMEGVYRLRDASTQVAQWDTYTVLTGLLIVPGENGVPTIIDQNGLTVGQIMADAITTGVLAAESVGAKQLIIGDISRAHLDADVDGVLADAEEIASRVVIEPSSITISRSVVGSQGKLTALRLEATKMDFIVDGKSVAYIDSDRNLMSIGNAYVRDSLQIGEHQVRRLGQGGITVFQYVGG